MGGPRYVVGPVVNSAHQCAHWAARSQPEFAEVNAWLDALIERPKQLRARWRSLVNASNLDRDYWDRLGMAEVTANDDALAFCLDRLGNAKLIPSVCQKSQWPNLLSRDDYPFIDALPSESGITTAGTNTSGVPLPHHPPNPATATSFTATAMPTATVPTATAMPIGSALAPFAVLPNVIYNHPKQPAIRLVVIDDPTQTTAIVEVNGVEVRYDLRMFAPGAWTKLQTEHDAVPLTLRAELPRGVDAVWS